MAQSLPDNWPDYLAEHPLPVEDHIYTEIRAAIDGDIATLQALAELAGQDPAASAYVLGATAKLQRSKERVPAYDAEHAVVMLGERRANETLLQLPCVSDSIKDTDARNGYRNAVIRGRHAEAQASRWLMARGEKGYDVVKTAALTHTFLEQALWRDAPDLARKAQYIAQDVFMAKLREFEQKTPPGDAGEQRDFRRALLKHAWMDQALAQVCEQAGVDLDALEARVHEYYFLPYALFTPESKVGAFSDHHQDLTNLSCQLAFAAEFGWYHFAIKLINEQLNWFLRRSQVQAWKLIRDTAVKNAQEVCRYPGQRHPTAYFATACEPETVLWPLLTDPQEAQDPHADHLEPAHPTRPGAALGLLMQQAADMPEVHNLGLYTFDDSRTVLHRRRHWQDDSDATPMPSTIALAKNRLLRRLLDRQQPLAIDDHNFEKFAALLDTSLQAKATHGLLLIPLVHQQTVIAFLVIQAERRCFEPLMEKWERMQKHLPHT